MMFPLLVTEHDSYLLSQLAESKFSVDAQKETLIELIPIYFQHATDQDLPASGIPLISSVSGAERGD